MRMLKYLINLPKPISSSDSSSSTFFFSSALGASAAGAATAAPAKIQICINFISDIILSWS